MDAFMTAASTSSRVSYSTTAPPRNVCKAGRRLLTPKTDGMKLLLLVAEDDDEGMLLLLLLRQFLGAMGACTGAAADTDDDADMKRIIQQAAPRSDIMKRDREAIIV